MPAPGPAGSLAAPKASAAPTFTDRRPARTCEPPIGGPGTEASRNSRPTPAASSGSQSANDAMHLYTVESRPEPEQFHSGTPNSPERSLSRSGRRRSSARSSTPRQSTRSATPQIRTRFRESRSASLSETAMTRIRNLAARTGIIATANGSSTSAENLILYEHDATNVPAEEPIEERSIYIAPKHSTSKLGDKPTLLVDCGSVGNAIGSETASHMASVSFHKSGQKTGQRKRESPLKISGIGKGHDTCDWNCKIPIALPMPGGSSLPCTFDSPVVPESNLPALFGLRSMKSMRTIIDTTTMRLHFVGPSDYDLEKLLPPGTKTLQCETSPSGHMVIPTDAFLKTVTPGGIAQTQVNLHANTRDSSPHRTSKRSQ